MQKIITAILLFLVIVTPAAGAGDDTKPKPPDIILLTSTPAQTITLPYEFEPIDLITSTETLDVNLTDVTFINQIGSIGLTLFSILDNFAILGIFVVLLAAVGVMFWIWSLVTGTPHTTTLRVFDAAEVAANIYDTQLELEEGRNERAARLDHDPAYWTGRRALTSGQRRKVEEFKKVAGTVKRGARRLRR